MEYQLTFRANFSGRLVEKEFDLLDFLGVSEYEYIQSRELYNDSLDEKLEKMLQDWVMNYLDYSFSIYEVGQ